MRLLYTGERSAGVRALWSPPKSAKSEQLSTMTKKPMHPVWASPKGARVKNMRDVLHAQGKAVAAAEDKVGVIICDVAGNEKAGDEPRRDAYQVS